MMTLRLRRKLQRIKYNWSPRNRNICLKCGFLSVNGHEAGADDRRTIAAKGQAGWFANSVVVDCYKKLWIWDADPEIMVTTEANRPRFRCAGFRRHSPGRSPESHLKLEDESREFRRRVGLGIIPFLGALLGALIGAWVSLKHH